MLKKLFTLLQHFLNVLFTANSEDATDMLAYYFETRLNSRKED